MILKTMRTPACLLLTFGLSISARTEAELVAVAIPRFEAALP